MPKRKMFDYRGSNKILGTVFDAKKGTTPPHIQEALEARQRIDSYRRQILGVPQRVRLDWVQRHRAEGMSSPIPPDLPPGFLWMRPEPDRAGWEVSLFFTYKLGWETQRVPEAAEEGLLHVAEMMLDRGSRILTHYLANVDRNDDVGGALARQENPPLPTQEWMPMDAATEAWNKLKEGEKWLPGKPSTIKPRPKPSVNQMQEWDDEIGVLNHTNTTINKTFSSGNITTTWEDTKDKDQPSSFRPDAEKWIRVLQVWKDFEGQDYEDVADALYGVVEDIVNNVTDERPKPSEDDEGIEGDIN